VRLRDAIAQAAEAAETTTESMALLVDAGIITRPTTDLAAVDAVIAEVRVELLRALFAHGPMHGPHEGYAVIREELDRELWELVCTDEGTGAHARTEALQVAAMGLRYVIDVCEPEAKP
jgi:hypothetical protein